MDELTFDRLARRFARTRLTRRTTVGSGGFAAATILAAIAIVAPARSAAGNVMRALATPHPEATPEADGNSLCKQPYALCSAAPCEQPQHGTKVTSCRCVVLDGYSIGLTSCEERAPKGNTLVSTFSTQNATSRTHRMTCRDAETWANCLDMPCQIDADDPTKAVCQCEIVESGPFSTMGGDCDLETCSTIVWSAAPVTILMDHLYLAEMVKRGQEAIAPTACPAATPMASPTGSS